MQKHHAAWLALAGLAVGLVLGAILGASYLAPSQMLATRADAIENFGNWPLETKVARSSVVLRTEWKAEDGFYKAVIAEIIKTHQEGSAPRFIVGTAYGNERYPIREGADYGDGEIQFFTGSPPEWQYSSVIRWGKLSGVGDASIDRIRLLARDEHAR